jgi:hypothetical protein
MLITRLSARWSHLALVLMIGLVLWPLDGSRPAAAQADAELRGDLGDAPDSSNHNGTSLKAYPNHYSMSAQAQYPSVFDPSLPGPQGPFHRNPRSRSWLGAGVSSERDADLLPDEDSEANIVFIDSSRRQYSNQANRDLLEDSLSADGINLPRCAKTSFDVTVSGAANMEGQFDYVNVWLDFNGNGRWGDTVSCITAEGNNVEVSEWAVKNQRISVKPGRNIIPTTMFGSAHTNKDEKNLWMRITLAESTLSDEHSDGSGPANGFNSGETEDYLMTPASATAASMRSASGADSSIIYVPDIAYYTGY